MPTFLLNLNDHLTGAQLDEFLTAGWRPVGQQLYTCDFIRTEGDELFGCLQVRLPLRTHQFKRKQRRMLRQNGEHFRVEIGPAGEVTREMREVNRRYIERNPDKSRPDLEFHIGYYPEKRYINTKQVNVYAGEKLVAFSYFDAGQHCLYSKAGIYDPAFKSFSLGIYTMLVEIEWAKANGYRYYHPGYISVDLPLFNYKLRLGQMEYRDSRDGSWAELPGNDPSVPADPLALHRRAMQRLTLRLLSEGIGSRIKEYPSFTARFYYPGHGGNLLDAPLVCQLDNGVPAGRLTLIHYDHQTKDYTVFNPGLSSLTDIKLQPVGPSGVARYPRPVPVEIVHAVSDDLDAIAMLCAKARDAELNG